MEVKSKVNHGIYADSTVLKNLIGDANLEKNEIRVNPWLTSLLLQQQVIDQPHFSHKTGNQQD